MSNKDTVARHGRLSLPLYMVLSALVVLVLGTAWAPWRPALAQAATSEVLDMRNAPADAVAAADATVQPLLDRARRAERAWHMVESEYDDQVAPIERVLRSYRDDPELTRRIAVSLVREARRAGLEPRMLLAVMLVENPWLDPEARSFVGAVGLMQVMPLHRGHWPGCGRSLEEIESNLCYGAQIFAHYLRRTGGNPERALLRYNGCVNGTNTPDCHRYPYHVYERAGRASMLAWLGESTPAAASP